MQGGKTLRCKGVNPTVQGGAARLNAHPHGCTQALENKALTRKAAVQNSEVPQGRIGSISVDIGDGGQAAAANQATPLRLHQSSRASATMSCKAQGDTPATWRCALARRKRARKAGVTRTDNQAEADIGLPVTNARAASGKGFAAVVAVFRLRLFCTGQLHKQGVKIGGGVLCAGHIKHGACLARRIGQGGALPHNGTARRLPKRPKGVDSLLPNRRV